jgi:hypothetical protein
MIESKAYRTHEENTEEENNGYIVFKLDIHGSGGK